MGCCWWYLLSLALISLSLLLYAGGGCGSMGCPEDPGIPMPADVPTTTSAADTAAEDEGAAAAECPIGMW